MLFNPVADYGKEEKKIMHKKEGHGHYGSVDGHMPKSHMDHHGAHHKGKHHGHASNPLGFGHVGIANAMGIKRK